MPDAGVLSLLYVLRGLTEFSYLQFVNLNYSVALLGWKHAPVGDGVEGIQCFQLVSSVQLQTSLSRWGENRSDVSRILSIPSDLYCSLGFSLDFLAPSTILNTQSLSRY